MYIVLCNVFSLLTVQLRSFYANTFILMTVQNFIMDTRTHFAILLFDR